VSFILLYHDVVPIAVRDTVGFPGALAARYKLEPALFAEHLRVLADAGVDVGVVEPGRAPPAVALTFDDGGSSAVAVASALERSGWRGHFFVPTSVIDRRGFLTREGIRELAAQGHVVGSHSHTHPTYMRHLSRDELDREWRQSREILSEVLGVSPTAASVAGGAVSRAVVDSAATAGYRILMTSEPTAGVKTRNGLAVFGRYAIWSTTSAARAVDYANGARNARMRLWVEWKAKNLAKRASPSGYELLRRLRAQLD
jgi:peptidoglycan/xylan/chitin deacetylase (PgdA/CDA1 family)